MSRRPIYYDTETTGIKIGIDRIIEIAAYDPIQEKTFSKLINPEMLISPEAMQISHITDEMVKDAPKLYEVVDEFIEFCEGDCVLIAHNNDSFDKPLLEAEFTRIEIEIPKFHFIDSLKWARKYRKDLPRHSLQYLRAIYEIETNQAHRALDDVMVLYQVFSKMVGDLSMETVMDLLASSSKEGIMPFGKHQGKALKDIPKNYIAWLNKQGVFEKPENKKLKEDFAKLGHLS